MIGVTGIRRAAVLLTVACIVGACHRAAVTAVGSARVDPLAPTMVPATVPTGAPSGSSVVMPPAFVMAAPTLRDVIGTVADSVLVAPSWRNARWGLLVVDVTSGDTLLSHDAGRLFMPASNQKLLTAAIALQQLSTDFRWHTPVLLRGRQRGSRFIGDVLVHGVGDPSMSDLMQSDSVLRVFDPVVRALKSRGITSIRGDVLTDGDAFTGPTSGYGWEMDDADTPYGAPIDELLLNDGFVNVQVYGGRKAGAPVRVVRAPTATYPPLVINATTADTVLRRDRVRAEYDSTGFALVLTGSVAVGDSVALSVSYRHPNDAFRAAMRERLAAAGVTFAAVRKSANASLRAKVNAKMKVTMKARATSRDLLADTLVDTLVVLESETLREVLPRMQKPSQNQIAELLFRTSGLRASGDGSADSARAVGMRTLAGLGVGVDEVAYRDGSGMSRHDYVTPHAIVTVLDAMRRAPTFALFRDALPWAGVDGSIANRMKGTAAAGNAHAKTGTIDKVRSLSGYVTTADGHQVIFSILCNNFTMSNREVDRVADLLVSTVAGWSSAAGVTARGR